MFAEALVLMGLTTARVSPRISPPPSRPAYTAPKPSPAPRPTPTHKAPKPTPHKPAPKPVHKPKHKSHKYEGHDYYDVGSPYNNHLGVPVAFWLMFLNPQTGKQELRCFDKDHFRITCDKDKPKGDKRI